jgi:hypothetical protein
MRKKRIINKWIMRNRSKGSHLHKSVHGVVNQTTTTTTTSLLLSHEKEHHEKDRKVRNRK